MFHVGLGEVLIIVVVALFVIGPTRLPKYAADAGRMLRQLRLLAKQASASVREELGPEFADVELADLHPRRFVRKHLFEDIDDDDVRDGMPTTAPPPVAPRQLEAGERPPYDAEAT
ncbi:MAG: sec-independent translocase [Actinomycetes bacterium]